VILFSLKILFFMDFHKELQILFYKIKLFKNYIDYIMLIIISIMQILVKIYMEVFHY